MAKKPFDKYDLYRRSVQSPESDVEFFQITYRKLRGRRARKFREDFCGTFLLSCNWVKAASQNQAIGVDLDSEPLNYGRQHYLSALKPKQQKRLHLYEQNVLKGGLPLVDITVAMNFSYYLFKAKDQLRRYFRSCLKGLKPGGVLFVDCFGGPLCQQANVERTAFKDFTYYWDQESFNPISNFAVFHIHYKRKGEAKREHVFSYDWRMWTIPEIREIMAEVGFRQTHVYWEGTARNGTGNGIFTRTDTGEECDAWVAYVVGEK